MARYYFHIREESRIIPDDEGMELSDIQEAWMEANLSADDIARTACQNGFSTGPCTIEIADQTGRVLGTVKVPEQRKSA